jgi:6-pyruvoyltetrahydropterin/6-carboxytetrahydropterin synthase
MYVLIVRDDFSAAHRLPLTHGKCERLHGHNWKVEVRVRAPALDEAGMALDFQDLKTMTRRVLEKLDHCLLNEIPAFQEQNPTAENLARYIYKGLADLLAAERAMLDRVCVWESETTAACYTEAQG